MGLEADQSVEDLHSRVFQRARPADIAGFVETRLHLDHHRDFLLGRGLNQGAYDGRIFAGAVQGLLDGKHVGIVGGGANEVHHRVVRIVRMVQQNVAMADFFKDVVRLAVQLQLARHERPEL